MILIGFGIFCLVVGLILYVRGIIVLRQNHVELKVHPTEPEFAVLIPARFESSVIEGLFESLKQQTIVVLPRNVYVIVESLRDPTVKLAKEYGYKVIVRDDIRGRERKGYALDEAIKQILLTRKFDLYFIFDADNVLVEDYIEQMLKIYALGYEAATGYRDIKNCRPNQVAVASSLTFSMVNAISNRDRIKYGANVVFSGTGCFVDGKLVDEWGGWPFHSLTEDYEFSLYATYRQLATFYSTEARFYDEQPMKFEQSVQQRVRWIRGYFDARRIYIKKMRQKIVEHGLMVRKYDDNCTNVLVQPYSEKWRFGSMKREIIGVNAVIWLVLGIVLIQLGVIIRMFYAWGLLETLGVSALLILAVYAVLALVTAYILWREDLTLSVKSKIKIVFFNPIYLATYIPCALKAIFSKRVEWSRIEHIESVELNLKLEEDVVKLKKIGE